MIFLLLSILTSTCLVLIFKIFELFKINIFQAIVFNYLVATSVGVFFTGIATYFDAHTSHNYMAWAAFQGSLFIGLFVIIGITTQTMGVAVASVASKMALVMPVLMGVFLYAEPLSATKIMGLLLALVAVLLCSIKPTHGATTPEKAGKNWTYPLIIFVGSGIADSLVGFAQKKILLPNQAAAYTTLTFASAASIGTAYLCYLLLTKKQIFEPKNLIAGIGLGIVNYFSLFCLLQALKLSKMGSAGIFAINNVGIVLFSSLCAYLFFKEKLSKLNLLGVFLAISAIALTVF